jgi:hypothetical protein
MRILLDENFPTDFASLLGGGATPQMFTVMVGLASRTASFFVARKAYVKYL